MTAPARELVIHSGALGDFVMTWPLIRALAAGDRSVAVAARSSHARLAARLLGPAVVPLDADSPRFSCLWQGASAKIAPDHSVIGIWIFLLDPREADHPWFIAARSAFPRARITPIGPPGSESRIRLWSNLPERSLIPSGAPVDPAAPIALHVGAGSALKRWPLDRCLRLAHLLQAHGRTFTLLAGEVEREQWSAREHAAFTAAGGTFPSDLDALTDILFGSGAYVGADTGPTHLAAALGLPTTALFGPTDPRVWAPRGPHVTVISAASGRMDSIEAEHVAHRLLGASS